MYESYYNWTERPFQLNSSPKFFYESEGHAKALAYLRYGLHQAQGFVVVTGEPGTGKSLLLETLLCDSDIKHPVVGVLDTTLLEGAELLKAVAHEFGLEDVGNSKADSIIALQKFFSIQLAKGKTVLLVVDEAQNLSRMALEELRMLANYHEGAKFALQVFLIGQPQLQHSISHPDLSQLAQRVLASYELKPLTLDETRAYIDHRLRAAGWCGRPSVSPEALKMVYAGSKGLPRLINILFDRVLLCGYLEETSYLDDDLVYLALQELVEENPMTWESEQTMLDVLELTDELEPLPSTKGESFEKPPVAAKKLLSTSAVKQRESKKASTVVSPTLLQEREEVAKPLFGQKVYLRAAAALFLVAGAFALTYTLYDSDDQLLVVEESLMEHRIQEEPVPVTSEPIENDTLAFLNEQFFIDELSDEVGEADSDIQEHSMDMAVTMDDAEIEMADSSPLHAIDTMSPESVVSEEDSTETHSLAATQVVPVEVATESEVEPQAEITPTVNEHLDVTVEIAAVDIDVEKVETAQVVKEKLILPELSEVENNEVREDRVETVEIADVDVVAVDKPVLPRTVSVAQDQAVPAKKRDQKPEQIVVAAVEVVPEPVLELKLDIEKERILRDITTYYEDGNLNRFISLFNEKGQVGKISKDYQELFAVSEARNIELSQFEWQQDAASLRGIGKYRTEIWIPRIQAPIISKGVVELDLINKDGQLFIVKFDHKAEQ